MAQICLQDSVLLKNQYDFVDEEEGDAWCFVIESILELLIGDLGFVKIVSTSANWKETYKS